MCPLNVNKTENNIAYVWFVYFGLLYTCISPEMNECHLLSQQQRPPKYDHFSHSSKWRCLEGTLIVLKYHTTLLFTKTCTLDMYYKESNTMCKLNDS